MMKNITIICQMINGGTLEEEFWERNRAKINSGQEAQAQHFEYICMGLSHSSDFVRLFLFTLKFRIWAQTESLR